MVAAKPDCTRQRFGMLTVLGKGSRASYKKSNGKTSYCYLWKLQCDCGAFIELRRRDFDRPKGGQKSCGCLLKSRNYVNRRPLDIAGQKFGSLQAVALTGKKNKQGKPTWQFQCDCGGIRELSLTHVRNYEHRGIRINCGNRTTHPERWLNYPPTPTPYPEEAGILATKYWYLTELPYAQIDSAVEDEKRDRLIRVAWIITYRRWQGEEISDLRESRIIKKSLRYCSTTVFWQRKIEEKGGLMYDVSNKKRQIGNTMTNPTSHDYPVIETQGINCIPKKLSFKRR